MRQARDLAFTLPAIATRTVFGAFALGRLAEELQRLGALRPLIVTSPGQRILGERVARTLDRVAGIHPVALPGVPRAAVDETVAEIGRQRADLLLAVGGGTAIGLAKAAGPEAGVPVLAAPTTCSGAELTPLVRVREASGMAVREDERAVPRVTLYEPDLAAPPAVLAVSALAAIAHCLPLLTAEDAAPAMLALAQAGVAALVRAIGRLAEGDPGPEWRTLALYGGWLGGLCLAASPGAPAHRAAFALEDNSGLPYADLQAALLPMQARQHAAALARTAPVLGEDPAGFLAGLAERLGVRQRLAERGFPHDILRRSLAAAGWPDLAGDADG